LGFLRSASLFQLAATPTLTHLAPTFLIFIYYQYMPKIIEIGPFIKKL